MPCRVCGNPALQRIFHSPPRSIIAITRPVDAPVNVYACEQCGHAQSEDIEYERFYKRDYRFQLGSSDYDELHAVVDGKSVFRTDLQARIATELIKLPRGAKILDYGAAKATTLRKFCEQRPGLVPHVFDVSDDYAPLWNEWISVERQAAYSIPPSWFWSFDVVFNFFVLEHVAKPNELVKQIFNLLRPDGICIFTVPNPLDNYSDFVVLEHVSHFTQASLFTLLQQNGFEIEYYSSEKFFGAHVVLARKRDAVISETAGIDLQTANERLRKVAEFWNIAQARLRAVAQRSSGRPCAIDGRANVRCFIDRNPHMWGDSNFGIPVVGPDQLPEDVNLIYAGVNPLRAHDILADVPEWRGRSIETIFLSES
jgi:SAM-dependent methyltransferase